MLLTSAPRSARRSAHGGHIWRVWPAAARPAAGGAHGDEALRPGGGEHSCACFVWRGGRAGGGGPRQQPGEGEPAGRWPGVAQGEAAARAVGPWEESRLPDSRCAPLPVQAIAGRTWSGIEFGEAPLYAYSFFQVRRVWRRGVPGDTTLNRHNPLASNASPVRGRRACRRPGPVQAHRGGDLRLVVPHPGPGRRRGSPLCSGPRPGTCPLQLCLAACACLTPQLLL